MEITRKIFWQQAARGGTIIGLVTVAFSLLQWAAGIGEVKFWGGFLSFISLAVFVFLLYGFTKKISSAAEPVRGFPYGRCIGFAAAMMIFTGFISGVYLAVFNNFIAPESVKETVDATMLIYQDMIPDAQFDWMYDTMTRWMVNPLYLVFAGILGYVFQGVFFGLFTGAFARKNPDIFADSPAGGNVDENDNDN